jgi:hypothetical protein
MSSLAEIEAAIDQLPSPQVEELEVWLARRRVKSSATEVPEPNFLGRAKAVWGESPDGTPLSELVSEGRG